MLVPLRQRPARVRTPLPDPRHLVHGTDQLQPDRRPCIDQRLRPVRIENGVAVGLVLEVQERIGVRNRPGLVAG